jgi:hypothetical protein
MQARSRYYRALIRLYIAHFRNAFLAVRLERYRAQNAAIARLLDERPRLPKRG